MNPIRNYSDRYHKIRSEQKINPDLESVRERIANNTSGLNNYILAGLGMATLILRMGAVIQICRKFKSMDEDGDILFMKYIVDNLRENLPSDSNWKNLWTICSENDASWMEPALQTRTGQSLLERFVTFRNRYVHQQIRLIDEHSTEVLKCIELLDDFSALANLFESGKLILEEGKFSWKTAEESICLHPFMQPGKKDSEPYIFQGLYNKKSEAHFLNTRFGNEEEQKAEEHMDPIFQPIQSIVSAGVGQIFDHSSRINYYRECFVGREQERGIILDWCRRGDELNMLPIKSPAGMGKGALVADVIYQLQQDRVQTLYHFFGSGVQNSLHAVLYHLILQGKRLGYWNIKDQYVVQKLKRLPSKFIDLIHFFQLLLDSHLSIHRNNNSRNLVIILDGLDEAHVAYSQLKIADWFYSYNEKEEPEYDWRSTSNIRWIFTYRCAEDGTEKFYQFPRFDQNIQIPELQPLKGLKEDAVESAIARFSPSEDFMREVIRRGMIN